MDYIKFIVAGVLGGIIVLAGTAFFAPKAEAPSFGAAANVTTITNPWVFQKSVTQTTTNTATSSLAVGCVQFYATSTATALHLTVTQSLVSTTTTSGAAANSNAGTVVAQYGACPV